MEEKKTREKRRKSVWIRKKKLKKQRKNNIKNNKSKLRNVTQYFHNTFIIIFK